MATAATPKYKLFRVFIASPPLSVSEITLAMPKPVVGNDRRRAQILYAIMRIFRSRLQKQPTRLREILFSRHGLADFQFVIKILEILGALGLTRPRCGFLLELKVLPEAPDAAKLCMEAFLPAK
jgi:hypothetical protein